MAKYMPELVKGMKNYGRPLGNLQAAIIVLTAKPFRSLFTLKKSLA